MAEEFDTSSSASRVRHAVAVFDDQRSTEVELLVLNLASDPMTVARRLKTTPEGSTGWSSTGPSFAKT